MYHTVIPCLLVLHTIIVRFVYGNMLLFHSQSVLPVYVLFLGAGYSELFDSEVQYFFFTFQWPTGLLIIYFYFLY